MASVREWAEVAYVPSRVREQRQTKPFRYLAIRLRSRQGLLFGDGTTVKHFAVVTNDWETDGQSLLVWQRGKAGTIEHVHRTLKDELAAGVYPSGKVGANAAWLRLQVLTYQPPRDHEGGGPGRAVPAGPSQAVAFCRLHPVRTAGAPCPPGLCARRQPDPSGALGARARPSRPGTMGAQPMTAARRPQLHRLQGRACPDAGLGGQRVSP